MENSRTVWGDFDAVRQDSGHLWASCARKNENPDFNQPSHAKSMFFMAREAYKSMKHQTQ